MTRRRAWRAPIVDTHRPLAALMEEARIAAAEDLAEDGLRIVGAPTVALDRGGLHVVVRAEVEPMPPEWEASRELAALIADGVHPVKAARRVGLSLEAARRVCCRRRLADAQRVLARAVTA